MKRKEALDILYETYDKEKYEVLEGGEDYFVKHDITRYYTVVLRKSDNTTWKICYDSSYEYGLNDYSVEVFEAEKEEITTTVWVPKGKKK